MDAAWVSVSLNPSPPPSWRLGRGLRLRGGGRNRDWRLGRARPLPLGARVPERLLGLGAQLRPLRARAPALVALLRRARPARLQSRLCPRMGWGSWEERAGARAGRVPPQPESAPAVWVQRADCRSADAPWSHGLAGTDAFRPGTGEREVHIWESSVALPNPTPLRPAGAAPTTHSLSPRAHRERSSGPPLKPSRERCLGGKRDITY